jgi:hypothetical protein
VSLTLAVSVIATGTAAAQAEVLVTPDASGDVVGVLIYSDGTRTPYPETEDGDIVRTRVAHRDDRVRIRIEYRDLLRKGHRDDFVRIRTDEGLKRDIIVESGPRNPRGRATMYRGLWSFKCQVDHRKSFRDSVLVIDVPRSCLGNPSWVRFRAVTASTCCSGEQTFYDAALTSNEDEERDLSPRVYHD